MFGNQLRIKAGLRSRGTSISICRVCDHRLAPVAAVAARALLRAAGLESAPSGRAFLSECNSQPCWRRRPNPRRTGSQQGCQTVQEASRLDHIAPLAQQRCPTCSLDSILSARPYRQSLRTCDQDELSAGVEELNSDHKKRGCELSRKFKDMLKTAASVASIVVLLPAAAEAEGNPAKAEKVLAKNDTEVGEIIVTAQHRAERLQDVGISISAVEGKQLARLNVGSSMDIARFTPGVHVSGSFGGQSAQYTIRGVTQNDFSDVLEGPVAVYFDDGYIGSLNGQIFGTFDLQRVEVLKGPQGTLFGRNATGGLVHFIPRTPTDQLSINARATYGRFNQTRLEGGIGGPLGGGLSARASLLFNHQDPIFKNVYPAGVTPATLPSTPPSRCCEDTWNDDTLGGRLQFQYETGGWKFRLLGAALRTRMSTSPYKSYPSTPVFNSAGQLIDTVRLPDTSPIFGAIQQPRDSNTISQVLAIDDLNRLRTLGGSFHIDGSIGDVDVASITDWKEIKKYFFTPADLVPVNFLGVGSDSLTTQFSQELRFSGHSDNLHWTAGAYYLDINSKAASGFIAPKGSGFPPAIPNGIDLINHVQLKTQSASLFSQVEWGFAPKLTLVVGGRIIRESQRYFYRQSVMAPDRDYYIGNVDLAALPVYQTDNGTLITDPYRDKRHNTLWAGKLQLEYRPNDVTLAYLGVNRGVKGGAYNAKFADGTAPLFASQIPYNAETLVSYEAGLKTTLLNGDIVANAAAFYYDYSNYQAFLFVNTSGLVQNRPATNYGIEGSVLFRPSHRLSVNVAGSIIRPEVKGVDIAAATATAPAVIRNVEPAFAPRAQLFVMANWTPPIANDKITLSANANYTSRFYNNLRNFTSEVTKGYVISNVSAEWEVRPGFTASVALDNIFDKRVDLIGFDLTTFCGCSHESYNRPRTWRVSFAYEY